MKRGEKMFSILSEIRQLRNTDSFNVDSSNRNRYAVILKESDATNTAYFFSSPIYNRTTKKLLLGSFSKDNDVCSYYGSNCKVTVHKSLITLKNDEVSISINLGCGELRYQNGMMTGNGVSIIPSLNGITVIADCASFSFTTETVIKKAFERKNTKYFALMKQGFIPYYSICPICSFQKDEVHPATIIEEATDGYVRTFSINAHGGSQVVFEINLYEPKLFGDTTVESAAPRENNAFGSSAFIGRSTVFGEMWLYSRPELSRISELKNSEIKKALLHIPCFSAAPPELSVYEPKMRFCSFGSTWNNKKPSNDSKSKTTAHSGYITVDLTQKLKGDLDSKLRYTEGIILKNEDPLHKCAAIATADNYSAPQILEIRYTPL